LVLSLARLFCAPSADCCELFYFPFSPNPLNVNHFVSNVAGVSNLITFFPCYVVLFSRLRTKPDKA
jgi:hypothetical protein